MLRLSFVLLLLANGLYWLWGEGALRGFGYGPAVQREPQRVTQQILPEAVQVLSSTDIKRVEAQVQADLAPKECLQAGPLEADQVVVLRSLLEADWPAGAWQLNTVAAPEHWIVYMGKFASEEALAKKRGELAMMNLNVHTVETPALQLGLSLGAFETEAKANLQLAHLGTRGIRTARVILEHPADPVTLLRLPAVSAAMKPLVEKLTPALGPNPLAPCP